MLLEYNSKFFTKDFYRFFHEFQFSEGNQEDIQEFLIYLLDIIHEDLNRVLKAPIKDLPDQIQIEINENLHKENYFTLSELELAAAKEWQNYLRKNRSIIVDLFQVFFHIKTEFFLS